MRFDAMILVDWAERVEAYFQRPDVRAFVITNIVAPMALAVFLTAFYALIGLNDLPHATINAIGRSAALAALALNAWNIVHFMRFPAWRPAFALIMALNAIALLAIGYVSFFNGLPAFPMVIRDMLALYSHSS